MRWLLVLGPALLCGCAQDRVRIDERGRTVVGGKELFVVGLTDVAPEQFARVARAGFNVVTVRRFAERPGTVLREAEHRGLKVIADVDLPKGGVVRGGVTDHPALLAWSPYPRPRVRRIPPELVYRAYRRVRGLDGDHPVVTVIRDPNAFPVYGVFTDVVVVEVVPSAMPDLVWVHSLIRSARAGTGRISVWAMIEAWSARPPTAPGGSAAADPAAVRAAAYLAFIGGARGLLFSTFAEGALPTKEPGAWKALADLARELRVLVETVPLKNEGPITISGHPAHAALRTSGGRWFLLYANPFPRPGTALLEMPEWPGPRSVRLELRPYEAGAFRLDPGGKLAPFPGPG